MILASARPRSAVSGSGGLGGGGGEGGEGGGGGSGEGGGEGGGESPAKRVRYSSESVSLRVSASSSGRCTQSSRPT